MTNVWAKESNSRIILALSKWRCLSEHGYTFHHQGSEVLPDGTEMRGFVFLNKKARRFLEFNAGIGFGPVFIGNTSRSKRKGFTVESWLALHDQDLPESRKKKSYIAVGVATKEEGIAPLLDFLEALFEGPMKRILAGEEWEDVPFDWDGYK